MTTEDDLCTSLDSTNSIGKLGKYKSARLPLGMLGLGDQMNVERSEGDKGRSEPRGGW